MEAEGAGCDSGVGDVFGVAVEDEQVRRECARKHSGMLILKRGKFLTRSV